MSINSNADVLAIKQEQLRSLMGLYTIDQTWRYCKNLTGLSIHKESEFNEILRILGVDPSVTD